MSDNSPDLDRLVKVYLRIRDKKAEVATSFREQEEQLNLNLQGHAPE